MDDGSAARQKNRLLVRRVGALAIDTLLVTLLASGLYSLLSVDMAALPLAEKLRMDVTNGVLFALCFALTQGVLMNGASPGKKIARLRVVSAQGQKAGLQAILAREFLGRLLVEKFNLWLALLLAATGVMDAILVLENGSLRSVLYYLVVLPWPMFISFAIMLQDKHHRALHDRLAGTVVVAVEEAEAQAEK